jgi:peptidoglycan/xylan/chitin deacetylase (PgdA/CDA1 family)
MLSKGFGGGVAYIYTNAIGTPGYLTWEQASEMYAAGWDIGNHGNHTDMTLYTQEELEVILENCSSTIEAHGMPIGARQVCYPFGFHNATVDAAMAATGMLTGRDATWKALFPDDPPNKYYLPSFPVSSSVSANDAISIVENAVRSGHVLILQFHGIMDEGAEPRWSTDKFHTLVDWMESKGIQLTSISKLYERLYL